MFETVAGYTVCEQFGQEKFCGFFFFFVLSATPAGVSQLLGIALLSGREIIFMIGSVFESQLLYSRDK